MVSLFEANLQAMVFEAGFRANCVIVFVIVLILPIRGPWDILDLLFIQMLEADHQQLHSKPDLGSPCSISDMMLNLMYVDS